VDGTLVTVFNRINAARTAPATSSAILAYKTAVTSYSDANNNSRASGPQASGNAEHWYMRQNMTGGTAAADTFRIVTLATGAIATSNTLYQGTAGQAACATCALTWSEGLALGNADYLAEWAAAAGGGASFDTLTTPNGTTTASRAGAHGTVTGRIVEAGYWYDTYSVDATDMMRLLLVNDGLSGNAMQAAVLTGAAKATYTHMSAGWASAQGCTMAATQSGTTASTACKVALIVTATEGYTNAAGVAVCQPTISYGGGVCDPDAWAMKVFEQMQAVRAGGRTSASPTLTAISAGCSGMTCTYAWGPASGTAAMAGDAAVSSAVTLTSQAAGVDAAAAAVLAMGDLAYSKGFVWTPGMYQAAKEQTAYLKTSSDAAAAHGTSSVASRAATYGQAGNDYSEGIYVGAATAENTVALLVIAADAGTTGGAFRTAFVQSAAVAQAGVACAARADGDNVCTAVVGSGYATSSAYAACVTPAAAAAVVPAGALALAAAGLASASAAAALLF